MESVEQNMMDKRSSRYKAAFLLLFVCLFGLLVANLCVGTVSISLPEVFSCLFTDGADTVSANIVIGIRLPRALSAIILGGALALSGYLLQTFFRNPIAGPFILGISSGAKLTVAIAMIVSLTGSHPMSSAGMILAAFAGAMMSMGFVLLLSGKVNSMSALIISGVMIGYICSAITDFLVTFAEDSQIVNLHNWSQGSFSGISMSNVAAMAVVVFVSLLFSFFLAKPIGAYEMGEETAKGLGVRVRFLRILLVVLSSVLSACIVAFAGPISFVGVATPHVVKRLLGSSKPLLMIPASFLGGGVFCLLCDWIARMAFAPTELSISTVTAVFGAPIVLLVMAGRHKERI